MRYAYMTDNVCIAIIIIHGWLLMQSWLLFTNQLLIILYAIWCSSQRMTNNYYYTYIALYTGVHIVKPA